MKLFIKEHSPLLILQIVQFGFVFLTLWLDGFHDIRTMTYTLFLAFFLLGCYITYRYITRRTFYKRLETPMSSLDDAIERTGNSPASRALDQLLKSQYTLYENQISETEVQKNDYMTFIDRWVHQMKTPLSVIELTAQELDEPDSSNIREETERIKSGLSTVLYMARFRTIEQDFRISPVKLEEIIHEVIQDNKRYFIRQNVYPKVESEREDIKVETDEKWLFFIITQLIQNAVKYSAGKQTHFKINISEREGAAVVEIKDYGIGIPEQDKKRIYQAFYTGENGRKYRESTGMGLFLVKKVTDYLGHEIKMESEGGKGTTFQLIFSPAQNITEM